MGKAKKSSDIADVIDSNTDGFVELFNQQQDEIALLQTALVAAHDEIRRMSQMILAARLALV